jgi:TonB family protein
MSRSVLAALLALVLVNTIHSQDHPRSNSSVDNSADEPIYQVCDHKNQAGCVTAPRAVKRPSPKYPKEARRKKIQGTVVVSLIVGADGFPRDVQINKSLGYGLDEEAIKAVQKWEFEPALRDGKPVAVKAMVEVEFRL